MKTMILTDDIVSVRDARRDYLNGKPVYWTDGVFAGWCVSYGKKSIRRLRGEFDQINDHVTFIDEFSYMTSDFIFSDSKFIR